MKPPSTAQSSQSSTATSNNPNNGTARTKSTINARLLYEYVRMPSSTYDNWHLSFEHLLPPQDQTFSLTPDVDGKLALSPEIALYAVDNTRHDIIWAIARTVIAESFGEASDKNPNHVNQVLKRFRKLAMAGGQMDAILLHAFLKVGEKFDAWIASLKNKHGMLYKTDYVRSIRLSKGKHVFHEQDNGVGRIVFGHAYSKIVASAESTPRGQMVRNLLEADRQGWGCAYPVAFRAM
jgi:hypothetical protein